MPSFAIFGLGSCLSCCIHAAQSLIHTPACVAICWLFTSDHIHADIVYCLGNSHGYFANTLIAKLFAAAAPSTTPPYVIYFFYNLVYWVFMFIKAWINSPQWKFFKNSLKDQSLSHQILNGQYWLNITLWSHYPDVFCVDKHCRFHSNRKLWN